MSETRNPHDADANEVSSRLIAGLKSCKSVVENYRAMLSGGETEDGADTLDLRTVESPESPKSSTR